jgi:hypothetical protein
MRWRRSGGDHGGGGWRDNAQGAARLRRRPERAPNITKGQKAMDRVERVRQGLVDRGTDSKGATIKLMMGKYGGIRGLAVAGASGLLALVYPEEFGTVDVMVTRALQRLGLPKVLIVDPKNISIADAETMIEIMRLKAIDLNCMFGTNRWTPRLVDRVLWVVGQPQRACAIRRRRAT